jgi:choline dehydrogenase
VVEHGFLTDPDGHDVSVLVDGVRLVRRLAGTKALSGRCEGELAPGADLDDGELKAYARRWVGGHASVLPTIPRANTHLPVLAVAERIAEGLRRR